ncbi:hypothetical protein CBL_04019 [Carabus blaptoides fortunei]
MKSFITFAILLTVSVAVVVNASLPAVCKDPESVYSHNAGHVWDMKATCGRYRCNDLGYVEEEKCPLYKLREECHMSPEDRSKPYPQCCPQPVCP